jgi:hypothetical protein
MLLDLMDKSLVYRKTGRGTTELAATHGGALSPAARRVLILLDGQRTLAELADLFGADLVEHIVSELEANGFARMVDPDDPGLTTQSVPSANYPPNLAHILPPLPPESKPRRAGSHWCWWRRPAPADTGSLRARSARPIRSSPPRVRATRPR